VTRCSTHDSTTATHVKSFDTVRPCSIHEHVQHNYITSHHATATCAATTRQQTTQFGIISITWQVLIYRQHNHTTTACYKNFMTVINMQWQKIIYIPWQVLCVTHVAIKLSFYMIQRGDISMSTQSVPRCCAKHITQVTNHRRHVPPNKRKTKWLTRNHIWHTEHSKDRGDTANNRYTKTSVRDSRHIAALRTG
jgi:hypothetical protein